MMRCGPNNSKTVCTHGWTCCNDHDIPKIHSMAEISIRTFSHVLRFARFCLQLVNSESSVVIGHPMSTIVNPMSGLSRTAVSRSGSCGENTSREHLNLYP